MLIPSIDSFIFTIAINNKFKVDYFCLIIS